VVKFDLVRRFGRPMTALSRICLASFHARQAETIGLGFSLSVS
jgi:hypothetical protein